MRVEPIDEHRVWMSWLPLGVVAMAAYKAKKEEAPADRPGMTAEQALDQQDVASGLWDREVSEPAILVQQQQLEGNNNPAPDLGSEHPASAQPRLRPVSVLLPEVVTFAEICFP